MKRLLLSAALAIAIHGLLLATRPVCLKERSPHNPESRVLTLMLAFHQPQGQGIPAKKSAVVIKQAEPRRAAMQNPQEKVLKTQSGVKISSKPEKEKLSRLTPKTDFHSKPDPLHEPQRPDVGEDPSGLWKNLAGSSLEEEKFEGAGEMASILPVEVEPEIRPIYLENPEPEYPGLARKRGYQGTVVLEVLVNRNGRVKDLRVFASSGYQILDRAAMASVKKWVFEPGISGKEKVEMWVRIPVRFQLR